MINHSFKRVISALLTSLLILSYTFGALAAVPADICFNSKETSDGIIELTLSVKNATFMGIQAAIRYNPEALIPVDENGNATSEFSDFAIRGKKARFFETIGLSLDSEKGLFGFTLYIMPGTKQEGINETSEYVASNEGIDLYTFRFKKISDKSFDFEIATENKLKPYQSALAEGIIVLNYSDSLDANVSFSHEGKATAEAVVIKPVAPPSAPHQLTSYERKQDVICLQIGKSLAIAHGKKALIDPDDTSVVPYLSNNRTLVPLRFVAETLGAEVLWEEGWDGCIIKKDGTEIEITFNSAEFKVNGEKVVYDAPIEITKNRTMVPIRFVSEHLGCHIYWNQLNKAVVISPKDNPWVENRKAEITALNEMLVTLLGLI